MDIFPAGKDAIAIYLDNAELQNLAPRPGQITAAIAAGILKNALGTYDDTRWEHACIELFPGRDSLLLFARIPSGAPVYFIFDEIESVISAAKSCPQGIISLLTYIDGCYIVTIYPAAGDVTPSSLFEYAQPLSRPENFTARLSEYGKLITGPNALDTIRESF